MKRIIRFMLIPLLVLGMFTTVFAVSNPNIIVGNKILSVNAVIKERRVLVPLRAIFESLNATVDYDAKTRTITGYQNGKIIILKVNNKVATVDGQKVTLDVPATVVKGNTLVPVRFIGESLGANVDWYNNTVLINSNRDIIPKTVKPANPKKDEFVEVTKESIIGSWQWIGFYTADGIYEENDTDYTIKTTYFSNNTYTSSFYWIAGPYKGSAFSSLSPKSGTYDIANGKIFLADSKLRQDSYVIKMSKDGTKIYQYDNAVPGRASVYIRE